MGYVGEPMRPMPFEDGLLPPVVPRDVSGEWRLVHWVTQSDFRDFEGLEVVFDLKLSQAEPIGAVPTPVWGQGSKTRVSGLPTGEGERSLLKVEGDLSGKALRLRVEETLPTRAWPVIGSITLIVSSPWLMRGTFDTNAANSRGVSIAMRDP